MPAGFGRGAGRARTAREAPRRHPAYEARHHQRHRHRRRRRGRHRDVRSYFTVFQATPALPLQPIIAGRYHDRFARADGTWHFADRRIFMDLVGDLREHLTEMTAMTTSLRDRACIVGIGETAYCRAPGSGMSQLQLSCRRRSPRSRTPGSARSRSTASCRSRSRARRGAGGESRHREPALRDPCTWAARRRSRRCRRAATAVAAGRRRLRADAGRLERLLGPARARDRRRWTCSSMPGGAIARDYYLPYGLDRAAAVVRADRAPPHARVRHHAGAARRDRGRDAQARAAEPERA